MVALLPLFCFVGRYLEDTSEGQLALPAHFGYLYPVGRREWSRFGLSRLDLYPPSLREDGYGEDTLGGCCEGAHCSHFGYPTAD